MPWAAVIGSPVSHSLSPVLHRAAWDSLGLGAEWVYRRLEVDRESLPGLIAGLGPDCVGLSVTMPCKQAVIPLMDAVDPLARAVGAVNTVVVAGGLLTGFNTDVHGIARAIGDARAARGLPAPTSAVILGARATASSALAAMGYLHVDDVTLVARRFGGPGSAALAATRLGAAPLQVPWSLTAAAVRAIDGADLVVSTVPVGAADDLAARVSPRPGQTLLDVVYAPRLTPLVRAFGSAGAVVAPGTEMLLHQAVQQVQLMTGRLPDEDAMRRAMMAARPDEGAPGVGD